MQIYDCHAHLADERLGTAAAAILDECVHRGLGGVLVAATRMSEFERLAALAAEYPIVRGALGVHPWYVDSEWNASAALELRRHLAGSGKLVAVGEIGLDFHHGRANAEAQLTACAAQLRVARELGLPVVAHNRKSWEDFFRLLGERDIAGVAGVCHNFTGGVELARRALDIGLHLSFGGMLTRGAVKAAKSAAYAPADRVLVETDCPYLPVASRRGGDGAPWDAAEVLESLAAARGVRAEALAESVAENYQRLLGD